MKHNAVLLICLVLLLRTESQLSEADMKAKYLAGISSIGRQIPWKISTKQISRPAILLNSAAFTVKANPTPPLQATVLPPTVSVKQPQQSVPNQQSPETVRDGSPKNEKVISEPTMINERGIQDEQTNLKKSVAYMVLAFLICLFVLRHQQNQKEEKIKKYVSISEYAQQFAEQGEEDEESPTRG